jgi:hypothetical protein
MPTPDDDRAIDDVVRDAAHLLAERRPHDPVAVALADELDADAEAHRRVAANPDLQQLVDALCREAVQRHRVLDNLREAPDYNPKQDLPITLTWIGELIGLRMAICLVHGWDPNEESDKEGKADELVTAWWERNHPEDWEQPTPRQE